MRNRKSERDEIVGAALRDLPVRGRSPDFFARLSNALERESAEPSAPGRAATSERGRRLAVLAATGALGVLVGALTTASVYAASVGQTNAGFDSPVTTFEPSEEWNMVLTTVDPDSPDLPIVWVANVPFAPEESTTGFPVNTIRGLPPEGIAMTVIGPREYTGETVFAPAQFPLTISQGFCNYQEYEGQLAPQVSMCLVDTMVGDQLLNVTVWFGTTTPSGSLFGEANAELARLIVPGQP